MKVKKNILKKQISNGVNKSRSIFSAVFLGITFIILPLVYFQSTLDPVLAPRFFILTVLVTLSLLYSAVRCLPRIPRGFHPTHPYSKVDDQVSTKTVAIQELW